MESLVALSGDTVMCGRIALFFDPASICRTLWLPLQPKDWQPCYNNIALGISIKSVLSN
ncbi:MAG: hypothetical protein ACQEXG_16465 [Pseudomonadota bacterium]